MILGTITSINGVQIRLTRERWEPAVNTHQEINIKDYKKFLKVISNPEIIFKGNKEELLAVQKVPGKKLWIVVPYREITKQDGFVLTAYFTSDLTWLFKKEIVWSKEL